MKDFEFASHSLTFYFGHRITPICTDNLIIKLKKKLRLWHFLLHLILKFFSNELKNNSTLYKTNFTLFKTNGSIFVTVFVPG